MVAILGLNAFHPDSSACLLLDGKLVGAVAEERLGNRNKHTTAFPKNAIEWLLRSNSLRVSDLDHVAIARSPKANFIAKANYVLRNPRIGSDAVREFFKRQQDSQISLSGLASLFDEDPATCNYQLHFIEHHLAHIASAYFVSPFEGVTAGFSYDGSGDFASAMAARCEGNKIQIIDRVRLPSSLGHFYSSMCQFIGFDLFGEEYKVMGLAPYGNDEFSHELAKIVSFTTGGWFEVNPKYLSTHRALNEAKLSDGGEMRMGRLFSAKVEELLGTPFDRSKTITQRQKDIARSTQVMFERAAGNCISTLGEKVSLKQLAMAGGCALNGVMNARIYRDHEVEDMYLQCAASDDGTAIGAAFTCWHHALGQTQRFHMAHGYWGPEYSASAIKGVLNKTGKQYFECQNKSMAADLAAKYIADGAVVGWYQGRSEWGPRALGNRSILANPNISNMKDIINSKIKKRESFRPFAPSVLKEDIGEYFEQNIESPFMMHVVKFKKKWRETFPAVTHVDGTGRLQSVDRINNSLYHRLISELKRYTGHGIVLNTSFNENEPVVDTPEQAISCFDRTDMDVLVLDRFIISKGEYQIPT